MYIDIILKTIKCEYLQHESLECYRSYIHAIVGFFIVEDHVLNTGNGLITRAVLDDMWTMALSKIVTTLQTHSVSKIICAVVEYPTCIVMIYLHVCLYFINT